MVETINTMVGGVTIADGQTRSLQLTESDDDNWTSKQTGGHACLAACPHNLISIFFLLCPNLRTL